MHLYGLIPCYNESKSLPTSFPILNDLLAQTSKTLYGLLFVNDGSTDSTKQVLSGLRKQLPLQLRVQNIVLDLENNRGKAGAVFEGMKNLKEKEKI
ncbi:MAG: glycosyltransferase [Candidatus Peribacteria bacterium]|jgi:glycosyltransferase involved in cell wall biosynthesis|nr:glycosyltransferase [Candidatus Peribacteria bacterium]